jgi:PIN domain nuclease of toxin-antitoxin system
MASYVVDTHALVWYLTGSTKLSTAARSVLDEISGGTADGIIPIIVLAEASLLYEKRRATLTFERILGVLETTPTLYLVPLDLLVVSRSRRLTALPDLHDRFIVATAQNRRAALITADRLITGSSLVPVVW